ncbi:MAG: Ig-like domain-containing protein, partial [Plesiomonas shigelloides]
NGAWEVTFADLAKLMADGTYSWVITATDIAGNSKELTGNFTFDSTPLEIDAKLLSDSGFDNADNVTNSENLQIQVNVNDTASSVRLVVWPAAGSQSSPAFEQTLNFTGGNQYLFDVAGLDEGEYQYSVFATDIAGNISQTSPITITIDRTPPVISEAYVDKSSDTGESDSDSITNDNTVTFKGVAEKGNLIELKIFSADDPNTPAFTFSVTVSAADGSFSIDTSALPDGTYYWQMVATDAAGNLSDVVKGTAPLIVDTAISEFSAGLDIGSDSGDSATDAITNQNAVQLSGKGEIGAIVTLNSLTNSTTGESISIGSLTAVVGDDGKWQLQLPELLVDGVYNWSVTISDIAGNSQTLSGSFTLDTNIDFTGGLDSSSDSGDSSDLVTNIAEPKFSGVGTDGDKITVQLTGPDGYLQTLTTTVQNGAWEVTFADLAKLMADGTYSWVITATDIAGNSKELTGNFTFDSTP